MPSTIHHSIPPCSLKWRQCDACKWRRCDACVSAPFLATLPFSSRPPQPPAAAFISVSDYPNLSDFVFQTGILWSLSWLCLYSLAPSFHNPPLFPRVCLPVCMIVSSLAYELSWWMSIRSVRKVSPLWFSEYLPFIISLSFVTVSSFQLSLFLCNWILSQSIWHWKRKYTFGD